jgi:glycosyltransferase involved in cell wall biosynthesis
VSDAVWHIFTGEYPPVSGGVGDYSAVLSEAMVAAGAAVHVWTGVANEAGSPASNGATVHRIPDAWSEAGLRAIDAELNAQPAARILLIQYVPNAWGQRGMNRRFCDWVAQRARAGDDVRLMIHEPFLPYRFSLGPARWYMAWVQRRMMRTLLSAANVVYLSIEGWLPMLKPYEPKHNSETYWLPVFSNIPVIDNPERVRELRVEIANPHQLIVGSFGTFGGITGQVTAEIFTQVLREQKDAIGLLLGRGSKKLAAQVLAARGVPTTRLFAFEDLTADEVSLRLQGCDLMVQPYPDGISSRRSSALAGMAHGLPIVTNYGTLTDSVFREVAGVAAIGKFDTGQLAGLAKGLLLAENSREGFGPSARYLYESQFAVRHTVAGLLGSYDRAKL